MFKAVAVFICVVSFVACEGENLTHKRSHSPSNTDKVDLSNNAHTLIDDISRHILFRDFLLKNLCANRVYTNLADKLDQCTAALPGDSTAQALARLQACCSSQGRRVN